MSSLSWNSISWDHTVLLATRQKRTVNTARLCPSMTGWGWLDLPTAEGQKAELTLVAGYIYIYRWFTCQ